MTFDLGAGVPEDSYQLNLFFSRAPDYGIVQAYLGKRKIGEPIDCYSPRRYVTDHVLVGDKMLLKGQRVSALCTKAQATSRRSARLCSPRSRGSI